MRNPISLVIVIFVSLVGALLIYFESSSNPVPTTDNFVQSDRPDFFMEDISSIKLNNDGSIHYRLTASNLSHYTKIDRTELTNPQLTLYQTGRAPWELKAKMGTLLDNGNTINLKNEVELVQKDQIKAVPTQLTTTEITIKPNEHFAVTDKPVTIHSTEGLTTAKGLKAFLNTNKIELLSEVHGVYYRQ